MSICLFELDDHLVHLQVGASDLVHRLDHTRTLSTEHILCNTVYKQQTIHSQKQGNTTSTERK